MKHWQLVPFDGNNLKKVRFRVEKKGNIVGTLKVRINKHGDEKLTMHKSPKSEMSFRGFEERTRKLWRQERDALLDDIAMQAVEDGDAEWVKEPREDVEGERFSIRSKVPDDPKHDTARSSLRLVGHDEPDDRAPDEIGLGGDPNYYEEEAPDLTGGTLHKLTGIDPEEVVANNRPEEEVTAEDFDVEGAMKVEHRPLTPREVQCLKFCKRQQEGVDRTRMAVFSAKDYGFNLLSRLITWGYLQPVEDPAGVKLTIKATKELANRASLTIPSDDASVGP